MEKVRINVGGTIFLTTKETLTRYPGTRLTNLNAKDGDFDEANKEFYFDRDPAVFASILNLHRTKELHVTQALCGQAVRNELAFWKVPESCISPCCWRTLHQVDQDEEIMQALNKDSGTVANESELTSCCQTLRYRVWRVMEYPNSSLAAKVWNIIVAAMIILASITYCLDTVPELRTFPENGTYDYDVYMYYKPTLTNRGNLLLFGGFNFTLFYIDISCLIFFTLEFLVHLLVCPRPKLFFRSFLNWIDALAVLIGWTVLIIQFRFEDDFFHGFEALTTYMVIKSMYVIRLFRVFRLMQSNPNLRIIFLALNDCKKELILLVFTVSILAVIFGSFEYFCEDTNSKFKSIPVSVWWAVVTMTTVGYGDMYPTTACGYAIGSISAFLGVLALTLPVAVIATHFSDFYCLNLWRSKHKRGVTQSSLFK